MTKHLGSLDINFEFFDAVDGRNGLAKNLEALVDRRAGLSDAEFACALSHMGVYQHIVSERINYAMVLEDDVHCSKFLPEFIFNKYYYGSNLTQLCLSKSSTYVFYEGKQFLLGKYHSYIQAPFFRYSSTGGYVISKNGAQHLLENGVPINKKADWPDCLEDLKAKKSCKLVFPPLVVQNHLHDGGFESMIDLNQGDRKKNRRRFLGIQVPSQKEMIRSFLASIHKPIRRRLKTKSP